MGGIIGGKYKLIELLGEGGMGAVYMAQQTEPVKRLVALKVIRAGMDSGQVLARFEAERQALAMMDHPNIARVLEAGTTDERQPYFVMELVKGVPITRFCDDRKLSPRERLELFIPVCEAIQHAHQKGIIHRDIKPGNVLVALYDGKPVPKVIDFGVAKAAGQPLTDRTLVTGFGAIVGTPEYMSPEQAELNQLDIDTRSDVFALGVLLYELLTGSTPLDRKRLGQAALLEILRIVREEEPPKPSTRISTSAALAGIAEKRNTDPARLSRLVKGELDWIVMKALEKDRNRRYDTATGLAKDVERYLKGDAVEACPPTLGYRFRKAYRRNRLAVRVTAAIVMGSLIAVAGQTWNLLRARDAEATAIAAEQLAIENEAAARRAEAETRTERDAALRLSNELKRANYFSNIGLAAASLENGQIVHVRELLDRTRPSAGETGNFEWHYLHRAIHREKATHPAEAHPAKAVAFSPNGALLVEMYTPRIAASTNPSMVRVWDQTNNREVYRVELDVIGRGVSFSPDGSLLAAWGDSFYTRRDEKWEGRVRIWEAVTGSPRTIWRVEREAIHATAFSRDGKKLAILRRNDLNQSWVFSIAEIDTSSGTEIESHALPADDPYDANVAYDPGGVLLVAWYGKGGDIHFRRGKREIAIPSDLATGQPYDIFFNAEGTRLGVFRAGNHVRIWDLTAETPKLTGSFLAEGGAAVSRFALSPDGRHCAMAQGFYDQKVVIWDIQSGQKVQVLCSHTGAVNAVAFGPDGRTLATGSNDCTVKVWDATFTRDDPERPAVTFDVNGVAARSDGRFLWLGNIARSGESGRRFVVRDVAADITLFLGPPARKQDRLAASAGLSPGGKWLVAHNWEEKDRAVVWEVAGQRKSPSFPAEGLPAIRSQFASENLLVIQQSDFALQVWDVAAAKQIAVLPGLLSLMDRATASADGRILVISSRTSSKVQGVRVWDLAAGKALHDFPLSARQARISVALNRDATLLAAGGADDQAVRIWDLRTGREAHRLLGHVGFVAGLAFSPDGNRLFTGGDSTVKLWNMDGYQEIMTFRHSGLIMCLALSRDGYRVATAQHTMDNMPVHIFDATPLLENPK